MLPRGQHPRARARGRAGVRGGAHPETGKGVVWVGGPHDTGGVGGGGCGGGAAEVKGAECGAGGEGGVGGAV